MRLKRHAQILQSTLKNVSARPLLYSQCNRFRYSSSSAAHPKQIAVLGGGISGLASAYFTALEFPQSKITIYEGNKQLGGWIKSKRVQVPGGEVLFEQGPRTLRPAANSLVTAMMIDFLDLRDEVVFTSKDSEAARNRFIYYPDRLTRMPNPRDPPPQLLSAIWGMYSSGLLRGTGNALKEPWKRGRSPNMTDESVGSFISRRLDENIAQNLVSPVIHGIYAGDIWELSVKTLFPTMWHLEGHGTTGSIWKENNLINASPAQTGLRRLSHPYDIEMYRNIRNETAGIPEEFTKELGACSTFSFKKGLGQLSDGLKTWLQNDPHVTIKTSSPVHSFTKANDNSQQVVIDAGEGLNQTKQNYDLVISTLQTKDLTEYVTVMTVNLFYSTQNLLPVKGFGYLIPQSVPFEQNPERALGVIFDSDAVQGQDTAQGTKVTVMLGGHWWNGWEDLPTLDEGVEMAKSILRRHLNITEEPVAVNPVLNKDCIPQYTVGYEERLKDFAQRLQKDFGGRLRVVGNQFNGIGVNDCITGAWSLVQGLKGEGWKSRSCGLDRALDERPWVAHPVWKSYESS